MSEINAIRNAVRAERTLIQKEKTAARSFEEAANADKKPANVVRTQTGRDVDISRGYNVRGPDGLKIPFSVNTPLDKAKSWTKNFYRKESDFEFTETKNFTHEGPVMRDRTDKSTYINYAKDQNGYQIKMSFTPASKRGQGVGAGMYRVLFEKAQKEGLPVRSDTAMSQASVDVWLRFKQLGYPIKENPRKKMGNGGWENSKNPDEPLFEFDPAQPVKKDLKPHVEAGKSGSVPKPDDADNLILKLRRQQGVPPEQREQILDVYNEYKVAEDPAQQQQLLEQLRTMIPQEKAQ